MWTARSRHFILRILASTNLFSSLGNHIYWCDPGSGNRVQNDSPMQIRHSRIIRKQEFLRTMMEKRIIDVATEDRFAVLEKKMSDMEAHVKGLTQELVDLKSSAKKMSRQLEERDRQDLRGRPWATGTGFSAWRHRVPFEPGHGHDAKRGRKDRCACRTGYGKHPSA